MKKLVIFLTVAVIATVLFGGNFEVKEECVRIHIRANSNGTMDQSVKYEVKDELVSYLTPYVQNLSSSSSAKSVVESKISELEKIADRVLEQNGYSYKSKVKLTREEFPARSYGEYTLDAGEYDALIVELGEAEGDNWWCVLFPPLCFTPRGEGDTVEYKSKILELCKEIFGT